MGGNAFRSGPRPLNVVRLSSEQYIKLRDRYQRFTVSHLPILFRVAKSLGSILLTFYKRAIVPPEAPEKDDHGDIDFLVEEPLSNFTIQDLATDLGAKESMKAGGISSFGIRISEDKEDFFQLDIHQCTKKDFEWENVIYSYGDIWHIIGSVVTRFGLAINNTGLHARIKEIEKTNKKNSLLLLTTDPQKMMDFLGLDGTRYHKGFSTLDELFEWATAMPLFRRSIFEKEIASGKNERVKRKRPMYAEFVTEWLPRKQTLHSNPAPRERGRWNDNQAEVHTSADTCTSAIVHSLVDGSAAEGNTGVFPIDERKDVLTKALLRFNKREQYQILLDDFRRRSMKDAMWKQIARIIPLQGKQLDQAMIALKATVTWKDGHPRLKSAERSVEEIPVLDADTVDEVLLPWVTEHWSEAVRLYEEHAH